MTNLNGNGVVDLAILKTQKDQETVQDLADADALDSVLPELKDEYRRLQNMVRGNNRLSDELRQVKGRELDLRFVIMIRLDILIEQLLGRTENDALRLGYELQFTESLRSMIENALRE